MCSTQAERCHQQCGHSCSRWFCTVLVLHKLQLYAGPVFDQCAHPHVAARLTVFLKRQPGSCMHMHLTSYQSRTELTSAHPTRHSLLGSAGCAAYFGAGAPYSKTIPDARRLLPPAPKSCADVFLCDAADAAPGGLPHGVAGRAAATAGHQGRVLHPGAHPALQTRSALCFQPRAHRVRMHSRGKAYCWL
jgi:hypothetical protein